MQPQAHQQQPADATALPQRLVQLQQHAAMYVTSMTVIYGSTTASDSAAQTHVTGPAWDNDGNDSRWLVRSFSISRLLMRCACMTVQGLGCSFFGRWCISLNQLPLHCYSSPDRFQWRRRQQQYTLSYTVDNLIVTRNGVVLEDRHRLHSDQWNKRCPYNSSSSER